MNLERDDERQPLIAAGRQRRRGSQPQFTAGLVSTGLDGGLRDRRLVPTRYDQSQATMLPGAVDVLPLKVQLRVLPLFPIVQVSLSVGPVIPKLAVATVGFVTESRADADAPP